MARRLWAFALAFVIIGAPVAATVCQVRCEAHQVHDMAAMVGHAHHSCAMPVKTDGPTIAGIPHRCGHLSDDPVGVRQALQTVDVPAVVAQLFFILPPDVGANTSRSPQVDPSPPGTLALIAQLRV